MSIKQTIDEDLKQAMRSGDKSLVSILRGLKSAILYVEVAQNNRETGLDDKAVTDVLAKEAKKRQESADLYSQVGDEERAQTELSEKAAIEKYLPKQMDDAALDMIIDKVVAEQGPITQQNMGQTIGLVKQKSAGQADGGRIASAVKSRME